MDSSFFPLCPLSTKSSSANKGATRLLLVDPNNVPFGLGGLKLPSIVNYSDVFSLFTDQPTNATFAKHNEVINLPSLRSAAALSIEYYGNIMS